MGNLNLGNVGEIQKLIKLEVNWPQKANFAVCLTHDVDRTKNVSVFDTFTQKAQFQII